MSPNYRLHEVLTATCSSVQVSLDVKAITQETFGRQNKTLRYLIKHGASKTAFLFDCVGDEFIWSHSTLERQVTTH